MYDGYLLTSGETRIIVSFVMEDRFLEVFRELVGIHRVARLRYSLGRSERIG